MICPACARQCPEGAVFCPFCAAALNPDAMPTATRNQSPPPSSARAFDVPTPRFSDSGGKFAPGTVLAKRYRIATLLGHGGLGEVYRAEDLRLSQSVALKFLPQRLLQNPAALASFHADLSAARQIAHPHVCRVYDIGEAEGRAFLSMEYIDGEDLASLLQRIGRLAPDKALEIARELCAGVAAAHDRGVVHRDLKPANVMIDGRGRAHITDFGIASARAADDVAYQAPEQLARQEVSVRSDLYSLGLILYEAFTGRRAFEAATREELLRRYEQSSPSLPSTLVEGLDRRVEKAIMRCLERDPAARPSSALEMARVLPGGDPLQASLAKGETPSPEMVAAAGGEGALSRRTAWTMLAGVAAGLAIVVALTPWATELGAAPAEQSSEELEVKAAVMVRKLGYTDPPTDVAARFAENQAFLNYRTARMPGPLARRTLGDAGQSPRLFQYRQSPQPLAAANVLSNVFAAEIFTGDPAMETSGMISLEMDPRGPLLFFRAVPPQVASPAASSPAHPDWPALIALAELDAHRFHPETPVWIPPVPFDAVAGWLGTYPQDPATPIHVVAAALQGKLVYFQVIGPWTHAWRSSAAFQGSWLSANLSIAILLVCLAFAVFLTRRNLRKGRSDPKGAIRIASYLFVVSLLSDLAIANHVASAVIEWQVLSKAAGSALYQGGFAWLLYMAVEPYVRRRWPELLIGWSRLLEGRFRDPRIGRELLVGSLAAAAVGVVWYGTRALPSWFDIRGWNAVYAYPWNLSSFTPFLGNLAAGQAFAIFAALQVTLLLLLALMVVRRKWLALGVTWMLITAAILQGENNWVMDVANEAICVVLVLWAFRQGVLAGAACTYSQVLLTNGAITSSVSHWYFGRSCLTLAVILAIALYGFRTALGNQPAFPSGWLRVEAEGTP